MLFSYSADSDDDIISSKKKVDSLAEITETNWFDKNFIRHVTSSSWH